MIFMNPFDRYSAFYPIVAHFEVNRCGQNHAKQCDEFQSFPDSCLSRLSSKGCSLPWHSLWDVPSTTKHFGDTMKEGEIPANVAPREDTHVDDTNQHRMTNIHG